MALYAARFAIDAQPLLEYVAPGVGEIEIEIGDSAFSGCDES